MHVERGVKYFEYTVLLYTYRRHREIDATRNRMQRPLGRGCKVIRKIFKLQCYYLTLFVLQLMEAGREK
jgi:hypothetical protein